MGFLSGKNITSSKTEFRQAHRLSNPRSFILSNSAWKILFIDRSFNIVPVTGLMSLKKTGHETVARQNQSFVPTTLSR